MKARRKPLTLAVWLNSSDEGAEPMPAWVKAVAEREARPGTTFLIQNETSRMLVPVGHYIIQGLQSPYTCDPVSFEQGYEIIDPPKPAAQGETK